MKHLVALVMSLVCGAAFTAPKSDPQFKKVFVVIFENENYDKAQAEPFFGSLLSKGAFLSNFHAEAHPSQPNYIALISGDTQGVTGDGNTTVDASHIGDLLEAKGKTWKVYAESYPGKCFKGAKSGTYVRKHNPFISFANVQKNADRCANIVNEKGLEADIKNGTLADFSLYIPDMNNDGHDTDVAYADKWFSKKFGPLLADAKFLNPSMLFVATFDESELTTPGNHIYTALLGGNVAPGSSSDEEYNHYNLLHLIESGLGIGDLGQNDTAASAITGVWR